ncbi:MAG: cadherin-like domain-containing protein, partial [Pseudomonadales bacterium]|nr:cadherin-like domain-containing protein [Pseudomonadales bacterium]
GNVLVMETDADGDVLTVLSVNTTGTLGLVTNNLDGTFTYNPNGQFDALGTAATATDSFIYTVSDGSGGTATATVTITVTGANDVPVALGDAATVGENLTVVTGNVLANDTDADGDVLTVLSVDTTGTLGLVTNNLDGTFTYNPNGQFEALGVGATALDSFSYTVSDGNGGTATASVSVTVTGSNDVPVALGDTYTAIAGQTSILAVLVNDSDIDGDTLTVTTTALSELAGSLSVNPADGSITYTPNPLFADMDPGQTLADAFVYTIADGQGGIATGTVTVNVGLDPAIPQPVEDFYTATPLTAFVTGDVLANDTGGSGALTVQEWDGQTSNGSQVFYNGDGTFTVFLGPQVFHDFDGTAYLDENPREEYFDYVVVDGAGQTAEGEVILDVGGLSAVTRTEITTTTTATITDTNTLFVNDAWLTVTGASSISGFLANLGDLELATGASLDVAGGIGSYGPLHLNSGSTLTLTSGIFGASWIDGNGTIDVSTAAFMGMGGMSPGASTGTLTIIGNADPNTVQLGSRHHLEIEIDSTGTDLLSIAGAADLDGNVTVRDIGAFPIGGDSFTIITTTQGYTGEIRNFELPVINGLVIDPVQNGTDVTLNFDYPTSSATGTITPTITTGEAILGGTGSDTFDLSTNATGDKFYGDLGKDTFIINGALDFARIDGGGDGSVDYDTLKFSSPTIDLRGVTAYQIDSIDVLDMADGGAGTLTLDVDSALNISTVLFVPADVGDHIILYADEGWASRQVFIEDHPFEEMFTIGGQNADGDNVDLLVSVNATAQIIEADGESLFIGSGGNDTLTGTANDERFIGRAGDDQILAGAGEDEVVYDVEDVTLVDGGADFDVLVPGRAPGASIDLTTNNPYINFESIDLGEGWNSNTLTLDLANVAQTGQLNLIFGDGTNQLIIEGTIDDYVILNGVNLRDGVLPPGVTPSTDVRFPDYTMLTDGTNTVLVENELFGPGVNHKPIAQPDGFTTINTQPIILDPLANDLDPDPGDTISLTSFPATTEAGVPLVDNGNGTWDYDPTGYFDFLAPGQTASDFFQYTITDSQGETTTGYVDITIQPDPSLLLAGLDNDATDEGTILVTVDVLANDQNAVDIVGFDRKTWWGADVKYNGDGTFTYDPDHLFDSMETGQTSTDGFSYTVTDGLGNTATGFVDLVINGSSIYPVPTTNTSTTTITTVTDLSSDLYINDGFIVLGTAGNVVNGTFVNNNELTVSAGGDLTVGQGLDNEGYVMLNGGTLFVERSDFDNYWDVSGTGTIDLSTVSTDTFGNTLAQPIFENEGYVYPGGFSATGTLSINGDAWFHRGGEVYVEINDTTATTTFDLLTATGKMELGGHLDVYPMAGFAPVGGQTYAPVTAGSIVEEFESIGGLDVGGGFVLDVTYNATDVTLTVTPVDIFGSTATTTVTATAPGQVLVGSSITHTETFDLSGNTTGAIAYGRGGDDTFLVDDFSFRRVDGGPGFDELVVPGGDLNLLASHYQVDGIELINLRDFTPTVLTTGHDALSVAADRDGQLNLLGDAGDEHFVSAEYVSWIDEPGIDFTDNQGNTYFTYFLYDRDFLEPVTVNVSTDVKSVIESPFHTLWYGSTGTDTFTDTTGDFNIFIGHGGDDIANLGAGFDEIVYDPSDVTPGNIDGGGDEALLVPFYGGNIDLSTANPYVSVETIDLEFRGPNSVKLDMLDVAQMGALDQFIPDGTTQVRVVGDAEDRVMLEGVLIHEFEDLSPLTGLGISVNTTPVDVFGQNFITLTDGTNTLFVSEEIYLGVGNISPETTSTVQAVTAAYTAVDTFTVDLLATAFDGNRDTLAVQGLTVVSGDASGILDNGDGTLTVDPKAPAYAGTTTTTVTYQ